MPAFLNWLLRLLPTNPICMRLVHGGSRRLRHLYIRGGYLGVMMVVLLFVLLSEVGGATLSMRVLAASGARVFELVSYLQVGLICLLTPVFMAGAIAQEANPKTWDILLTTPLNNPQIVLGNLFGRLFFIIALLFSSLPLFAVTQYFGGVPGDSIFASYAIAGSSSLVVAAIAVTLSVTRTAGRRTVFIFYVAVIAYLFATVFVDLLLRRQQLKPVGVAFDTTWMTPLNPFLALEVLLQSNTYRPRDPIDLEGSLWFVKMWLSRPIAAFCWLCVLISLALAAFSTIGVRRIGARTGTVPWYRRIRLIKTRAAGERLGRHVANNPVAWRERTCRGNTPAAIVGRWGFAVAGVVLAITLVVLYHNGAWPASGFQLAIATVMTGEIAIISLIAINMSATAVSREREDGTLDLILTTPIQPGPYLAGKLRGLVQYLVPMMLVPIATAMVVAVYLVVADAAQWQVETTVTPVTAGNTLPAMPLMMPEAAIALPLVLVPFIAFCVMVGLHWSIRSKGTIGSVIAAVIIVVGIAGLLSLCGMAAGAGIPVLGPVFNTLSPVNLVFTTIFPADMIPTSLSSSAGAARTSIVVGSVISAVIYTSIVYGMHSNMKRTFMFTVRKLAGTN